MKKIYKISFLVALIFFLTGCQFINRVPIQINSKQFTETMQNYNFKVINNTKKMDSEIIKSNLIAVQDKKQIEFYKFKNKEDCETSFNSTKKMITSDKDGLFQESTNKNCSKLIVTKTDKYFTLVKIENIMLYCASDLESQSDIEAIIANFNY